MNKKLQTVFISIVSIACFSYFISCSKQGVAHISPTCKVVTISDSIIAASACSSNGGIIITASGSNGLMFKLNSGGIYQVSDTFNNIPVGTYTVYVKDSAGCETTAIVVVTSKIIVNATPISSSPCSNNGSIIVTASGSGGFTYKLNSGGTYQPSDTFTNVGPGVYSVYAKDSTGCETVVSVTVDSATAGALFTSVESLIASKCQSCHNNSIANDGYNWQDQCNIILYQSIIQSQVNSNLMPYGGPPLTTSGKAIITNWINAGGGYSN